MEIYLSDKKIHVNIIRKKIKNIYFRFDNNLNLNISCGKYVSDSKIISLIEKNASSLEKMLSKVEAKEKKNEEFWFLGQKYDIKYLDIPNVIFQNNEVICKDEETLKKFITKETKKIFIEEIDNLKKIINPPEFKLKVRKMKTRWGVCNYKLMTITLNSELIRYDKENIRYVIVHEMCHFTHHNHSKAFWDMVELYYPNYKKARKELRY